MNIHHDIKVVEIVENMAKKTRLIRLMKKEFVLNDLLKQLITTVCDFTG